MQLPWTQLINGWSSFDKPCSSPLSLAILKWLVKYSINVLPLLRLNSWLLCLVQRSVALYCSCVRLLEVSFLNSCMGFRFVHMHLKVPKKPLITGTTSLQFSSSNTRLHPIQWVWIFCLTLIFCWGGWSKMYFPNHSADANCMLSSREEIIYELLYLYLSCSIPILDMPQSPCWKEVIKLLTYCPLVESRLYV